MFLHRLLNERGLTIESSYLSLSIDNGFGAQLAYITPIVTATQISTLKKTIYSERKKTYEHN